MAIERTTFNGIIVGPYMYPASRRRDGKLYVRTFTSPKPALEFLLGALSSGDVYVMFDGERIPFRIHDDVAPREPWKVIVATLANDHERNLLELFGINPLRDVP